VIISNNRGRGVGDIVQEAHADSVEEVMIQLFGALNAAGRVGDVRQIEDFRIAWL